MLQAKNHIIVTLELSGNEIIRIYDMWYELYIPDDLATGDIYTYMQEIFINTISS